MGLSGQYNKGKIFFLNSASSSTSSNIHKYLIPKCTTDLLMVRNLKLQNQNNIPSQFRHFIYNSSCFYYFLKLISLMKLATPR